MTKTTTFGTSKRESHDSSDFYNRNLYSDKFSIPSAKDISDVEIPEPDGWANEIYCKSSEQMSDIPDNGVALAFTSPPYNVGKDYDNDMLLDDYLEMIHNVAREIYRVLRPGGRYVINIANLGRSPYIPLHSLFYEIHMNQVGFLPMGEIIWQKSKGASGSCAWGSWKSAKSPRLRDIHEYLLVFGKEAFTRPDKGQSDIERDEFMDATLSIWNIPPASAKKIGHPAPFPIDLAKRVIQLYSYVDDVVLDPFVGSGTTCLAAAELKRHYVGYDTSEEYHALATKRLREARI